MPSTVGLVSSFDESNQALVPRPRQEQFGPNGRRFASRLTHAKAVASCRKQVHFHRNATRHERRPEFKRIFDRYGFVVLGVNQETGGRIGGNVVLGRMRALEFPAGIGADQVFT